MPTVSVTRNGVTTSGLSLDTALSQAQFGDIITLTHGQTYTPSGSIFNCGLPGGSIANGYVIVQSDALASLGKSYQTVNVAGDIHPDYSVGWISGARVSPSQSGLMAQMAGTTPGGVLSINGNAKYWKFAGIEFLPQSPSTPFLNQLIILIASGGVQPDHIWFDQCYIHAWPQQSTYAPGALMTHGIYCDVGRLDITSCYISEIKGLSNDVGGETHGVNVNAGSTGPLSFVNNYIEAAGQCILFGGSGPDVGSTAAIGTVKDSSGIGVRMQYNTFTKNLAWNPSYPGYVAPPSSTGGTGRYVVKVLTEFKTAQNVLIDHNFYQYNWIGDQTGQAISSNISNYSGNGSEIFKNVTITNNVIDSVVVPFEFAQAAGEGSCRPCPPTSSEIPTNVTVRNNHVTNLAWPYEGTDGVTGAGNTRTRDLWSQTANGLIYDHNTVIENISSYGADQVAGFSFVQPVSGKFTGLSITNNIGVDGYYGTLNAVSLSGGASFDDQSGLAAVIGSATISKNAFYGLGKTPVDVYGTNYVSGLTSLSAVGLKTSSPTLPGGIGRNGGNVSGFSFYQLPAGSSLKASDSSNGGLCGCDISQLSWGSQAPKIPTSVSVSSSGNPSLSGQSVTFTPALTWTGGSGPTGIITWTVDNVAQSGSFSVAGATSGQGISSAALVLSNLSIGSHSVVASYSGDANYAANSGSVTQTVNTAPTTSTTTLTASVNPVQQGQAVLFTATVNVPAPDPGRQNFVDFETGNLSQVMTNPGPVNATVVTSPALAGTYSLQLARNNSVANVTISTSVTSPTTQRGNLPTVYYNFLFEYTVPPPSGQEGTICNFHDNAGNFNGSLHLLNNGGNNVLRFYDQALTTSTGTTVLAQNQSYNIGVKISTSSYQVTINGKNEPNLGGAGTFLSSNGDIELGGNTGQINTFIYDNVYVNANNFQNAQPINPSGTITFAIDGVIQGSPINLSNNSATLGPITTLSVGNHTITATYSGDGNYTPSSAKPLVEQVLSKQPTTTTVTSSVNNVTFGTSITYTATVTASNPSAGTPTGTVQFGDQPPGQSSPSNFGPPVTLVPGGTTGTATATSQTTTTETVGTHAISAVYSGDSIFAGSIGTLTGGEVIQPIQSGVTLTASANPITPGTSVSWTAVVSGPGGTPTGTVQFQIDGVNFGSPVTLSGGNATSATTTTLSPGSHTITASYSGDSIYTPSSQSLTENVTAPQNTVLNLTSSSNPVVVNQPVSFTAQPTAIGTSLTPTGTVQFQIDGVNFGSAVTLSGGLAASGTTSSLSVGNHTVTATYSGDTNFTGSSASLTQVVNPQISTKTVLTASANPVVSGTSVTFTATVNTGSSIAPTGTVQFQIDGINFGSAVAIGANGVAQSGSTNSLSVGNHTISATYSGDANFLSSSGSLIETIQSAPQQSTMTTVTASPNPLNLGGLLTVTAQVSSTGSGTPSGTVTFARNAQTLATVTLAANGTATTTDTPAAAGSYTYSATYSGDINFTTSSGSTTVTVNNLQTPILDMVSVSGPNPTTPNTNTYLGVSVTGQTVLPTGTVAFSIDGTTLATGVALMQAFALTGRAFIVRSGLPTGTHTITASYSGDSNYQSAQAQYLLTVNPLLQSSIILTSSANPQALGGAVYLRAFVTGQNDLNGIGSLDTRVQNKPVTFSIDGSAIGSPVPLNTTYDLSRQQIIPGAGKGVAIIGPITNLSIGSHTIAATYQGDPTYASSTAAIVQRINQPQQAGGTNQGLVGSTSGSSDGGPLFMLAGMQNITANGISLPVVNLKGFTSGLFQFTATPPTGGNPTLDLYLQTSFDGGVTWQDIAHTQFGGGSGPITRFAQLTSAYNANSQIIPASDGQMTGERVVQGPWGDQLRLKWVFNPGGSTGVYVLNASAYLKGQGNA